MGFFFCILGIKYYMSGGGSHYGRVEISVGGINGTICDAGWDNKDASVFCRQFNYTEGVALASAAYGQGRGPIWLSHLQCNGDERNLHQCPHRGFNDQFSESNWILSIICDSHRDDASVFCYKNGNNIILVLSSLTHRPCLSLGVYLPYVCKFSPVYFLLGSHLSI
jgi:hypothetical protein